MNSSTKSKGYWQFNWLVHGYLLHVQPFAAYTFYKHLKLTSLSSELVWERLWVGILGGGALYNPLNEWMGTTISMNLLDMISDI